MEILEHFEHHGRKQNKDHFINLTQIALADGAIDQTETEMLYKLGRKMGFTEQEIATLIESTNKQPFAPPYEFFKRFEQVYEVVKMVLADNVIDESEMRLATNFAIRLGFTENEIPSLLKLVVNGIQEGKDDEDLFDIYKKQRKV